MDNPATHQLNTADSSHGAAVVCDGQAGHVTIDSNGDFSFITSKGSLLGSCFPSAKVPSRVAKHQIVGATLESTTSFKIWYCCATKPNAKNPNWKLHTTRPFVCNTASVAEDLVKQLRQDACWWGRSQPPRAVILVNPTSGKLKAKAMWKEVVQPVLAGAAGWTVEMHETLRHGHAVELVQGLDLQGVDVLLFLGGDGTLYEGLQGLLQRPDWKEAVRMPIGHIPGGTGNGVASSAGLWDAVSSVRAVCKGTTRPLDVASVLQAPSSRHYIALSVTYGIVSNLEVGTDHLRWMGDGRFTYGAIREVFRGGRHRLRAAWLPSTSQYQPPSDTPKEPGVTPPQKGPTISSFPEGPALPLLSSLEAFSGGALPEQAPSTSGQAPAGWKVVGEHGMQGLEMFTLANVPYLAASYHCNPEGALDSGHMNLVWGGGRSKVESLKSLVLAETGAHLQLPWLNTDTVCAMVLEPVGDSSHFRLDGEVVPNSTLYLEVHPSLCNMLVAP